MCTQGEWRAESVLSHLVISFLHQLLLPPVHLVGTEWPYCPPRCSISPLLQKREKKHPKTVMALLIQSVSEFLNEFLSLSNRERN